jgi:hypothetical protein
VKAFGRVIALFGLVGSQALLAQSAADFLPMAVGNRWEYQMDVSADRQVWEVTAQHTVKQTVWFVVTQSSTHQDADGKNRTTVPKQTLVRAVGAQLVTLDHSKKETIWIDFAAPAGRPYASPGACHTKATNSPGGGKFVVLYDQTCNNTGLLDQTFVLHLGMESFSMDSFAGTHFWSLIAVHVDGKDLQP